MTKWISDNSKIVSWFLKKLDLEQDLDALVLEPDKLYKVKLLEDPKLVEGTKEGYRVKVRNEADQKIYILFLQRTLASQFQKIEAKKGDILAVINKGRDMQTGYSYVVGRWNRSFNLKLSSILDRNKFLKKRKEKN